MEEQMEPAPTKQGRWKRPGKKVVYRTPGRHEMVWNRVYISGTKHDTEITADVLNLEPEIHPRLLEIVAEYEEDGYCVTLVGI
jgi:hypothetical protein